MKKVTQNTEFIIGIDFGHGETSASFYNIKTQEKKDLDILPGHKVIKSAVAILEQEGRETICVGDAAIQNAPFAKDFQVSFKKRPSEMSKIERNRMVSFMKGVYAGILDRHPDYKTREHVVYIARPSQDSLWKTEEKAYLSIAEEAGLPVAGLQKESRAAYFRARTQPDSVIDKQVEKGILIVDFGSSTIDFTYLNSSLTSPIDDGWPLGAGLVEKILLDYAMANPTDTIMPKFVQLYGKDESSNPYNQLLYKFREAKEAFYGNKLPCFNVMFDYGYLTSSEKEPLTGFGGISIPRDQLDKILGKGEQKGYILKVKEAVKEFKNTKLKKQPVVCVYLTGGASRMDFVRDVFMEVFGLDESHCISDDHPSEIVSQGVAHLSYADIKTKKKEGELKKIAQSVISEFNWEEKFNSIISSSIQAKIIETTSSLMKDYRDGKIGEFLILKKDTSPAGEYINMESSKRREGPTFVRNIRSLNRKFKDSFAKMLHYEFASECESMITEEIVQKVVEKLKNAFSAFEYNPSSVATLKLSGVSATVTSSGAEELSAKFTGDGKGHIIYDAVASCWMAMRVLNLFKDRWDADRAQHYEYYCNNYADIFAPDLWEKFLNTNISISGIDSAERQTKKYIDNLINDYVSDAKLAIFF